MEIPSVPVQVKQFDSSLPHPEYKTPGAAGVDLYARMEVEIAPHSHAKVPLNVAVALPEGYWALLAARSSLHKKGLAPINAVGIIDNDYRGDNDEYISVLYNFTDASVTVAKGDRIMQAVILPLHQFPLEVVEHLGNPDRGGLGSTGHN